MQGSLGIRTNPLLDACLLAAGVEHGDAERFVKRLSSDNWERHFATTSTGHYVMAPLFTQPGDVVCIVFGCEDPLILRRKGTEYQGRTGEFWQLIGNAYVYGIMEVSSKGGVCQAREF